MNLSAVDSQLIRQEIGGAVTQIVDPYLDHATRSKEQGRGGQT